uniref:(northern house mosquito) hypothetical protein n=1 Tax=Culex pipiens TaxID=7175 RepID=A0A8D8DXE7_CULPI
MKILAVTMTGPSSPRGSKRMAIVDKMKRLVSSGTLSKSGMLNWNFSVSVFGIHVRPRVFTPGSVSRLISSMLIARFSSAIPASTSCRFDAHFLSLKPPRSIISSSCFRSSIADWTSSAPVMTSSM